MAKKVDDWVLSTASATEALSTSISSSTAAGHPKLAAAGERLSKVVINVFQPVHDPETQLTNAHFIQLNTKIADLENEVQRLRATEDLPKLREFLCEQQFRACMASASHRYEQATCWMSLVACLARDVTTIVSKPGQT